MRSRPVVAIDGPAGAGKSTVTRRVAQVLSYLRVDTGALYRSVAWVCLDRQLELGDAEGISAVAKKLAEPGMLTMTVAGDETKVRVEGRDVSQLIRSQEVSLWSSQVSQLPGVRAALLDMQRSLGRDGGVVLEGRDIGTVVFPDAEVKFFLTASVQVRAERRRRELVEQGKTPSLEEVEREVQQRDDRDSLRSIAPLLKANNAVEVDSSELSLEQVVNFMVDRVRAAEQALREGQR